MKRVAVARARIAHEANTKNGPMDQTLLVNTFVIDFFGYRAAHATPREREDPPIDVESELTDATRPSAVLTLARARAARMRSPHRIVRMDQTLLVNTFVIDFWILRRAANTANA